MSTWFLRGISFYLADAVKELAEIVERGRGAGTRENNGGR